MRGTGDQKKYLIKCLAIIAQPLSLGLPFPAVQLIAQGGLYALADAIIGDEVSYPRLEDVMSQCDDSVVSAVEDILDSSAVSLPNDRYYTAEETARVITEKWFNCHPLHYSEQEENIITSVLAEYFIKVGEWKLNHPEILRQIFDRIGDDINRIKTEQFKLRNQVEGIGNKIDEQVLLTLIRETQILLNAISPYKHWLFDVFTSFRKTPTR